MQATSIIGLATAGLIAVGALGAAQAAEEVTVPMNLIDDRGIGKSIGEVTATNSDRGFLVLKMNLSDELPPGGHGFHVHENPNCAPAEKDGEMTAGVAAGGHFDPRNTGKHRGPSGDGHLGDLPILYVGVSEDGTEPVTHSLVAPRLAVEDIRGRSLMIHANSDNFRDEPKPLGGGGARIACGVIP